MSPDRRTWFTYGMVAAVLLLTITQLWIVTTADHASTRVIVLTPGFDKDRLRAAEESLVGTAASTSYTVSVGLSPAERPRNATPVSSLRALTPIVGRVVFHVHGSGLSAVEDDTTTEVIWYRPSEYPVGLHSDSLRPLAYIQTPFESPITVDTLFDRPGLHRLPTQNSLAREDQLVRVVPDTLRVASVSEPSLHVGIAADGLSASARSLAQRLTSWNHQVWTQYEIRPDVFIRTQPAGTPRDNRPRFDLWISFGSVDHALAPPDDDVPWVHAVVDDSPDNALPSTARPDTCALGHPIVKTPSIARAQQRAEWEAVDRQWRGGVLRWSRASEDSLFAGHPYAMGEPLATLPPGFRWVGAEGQLVTVGTTAWASAPGWIAIEVSDGRILPTYVYPSRWLALRSSYMLSRPQTSVVGAQMPAGSATSWRSPLVVLLLLLWLGAWTLRPFPKRAD